VGRYPYGGLEQAGEALGKPHASLFDRLTGAMDPFFETRATNSSNLESSSFRMGDLFDLL
jgi:hypothetical protein